MNSFKDFFSKKELLEEDLNVWFKGCKSNTGVCQGLILTINQLAGSWCYAKTFAIFQ